MQALNSCIDTTLLTAFQVANSVPSASSQYASVTYRDVLSSAGTTAATTLTSQTFLDYFTWAAYHCGVRVRVCLWVYG